MSNKEAKLEVTPDQLSGMIAEAVAKALADAKPAKKAKGKGKPGRKPMTDEEKAANRAKIEKETVAAFKKAGYDDVKPRENVMTYNKWIEAGRRVKKGEKSVKCGSFPLFHLDQTEAITVEKANTVH